MHIRVTCDFSLFLDNCCVWIYKYVVWSFAGRCCNLTLRVNRLYFYLNIVNWRLVCRISSRGVHKTPEGVVNKFQFQFQFQYLFVWVKNTDLTRRNALLDCCPVFQSVIIESKTENHIFYEKKRERKAVKKIDKQISTHRPIDPPSTVFIACSLHWQFLFTSLSSSSFFYLNLVSFTLWRIVTFSNWKH